MSRGFIGSSRLRLTPSTCPQATDPTTQMNLRSGKTLTPMPPVPNTRLEQMRTLHDSILKEYVCFSTRWPSLEEARALSISTDDQERFGDFCQSLTVLSHLKNNDVYTNRLLLLAITESFFRCGLPLLQTYYKLMVTIYKKLKGAYTFHKPPKDLEKYLVQLKDLMFRVANEQQLLELMSPDF